MEKLRLEDYQGILEHLQKVNAVLAKEDDFPVLLDNVVSLLGHTLDCDRLWLLQPGTSQTIDYTIQSSYSLPNFSGIKDIQPSLPLEEDLSHIWPIVTEQNDVCIFSAQTPNHISEKITQDYGMLSIATKALKLRTGSPWMLCIQQCSYDRIWNEAERQMITMTADRLTDVLNLWQVNECSRDSERKLLETQQLAHVGNWYWDVKTGEVEWTAEVYNIFKLDPQTFIPQIDSILKMSPWPGQHERDQELIEKAIQSHEAGTYEQKFIKADGTIGYYYSSFQGEYDENNELVRIKGTVQDITERKVAELVLRESEQKFSSYVEYAPFGIFVADKDGNLVDVNKVACDLTGYTKEELLEKNIAMLDLEEGSEEAKERFNILVTEGMLSATVSYIKKDGTKHFWAMDAVKISEERFLGFANDVTERIESAEELKRINKAMQQSPIAVEITDLNGNIIFVNPKFTEMTGYLKEDVLGNRIDFLDPEKNADENASEIWKILLSGKEWHGEFQNKKKNGDVYWQDVVISAISNEQGELSNFISVEEDITEKKKLWADLLEAKNRAEESDRLKSSFLTNISHEIRTPMNGILGFSTLLMEPRMREEEKDEYIKMIHKSGNRMLSIINDLIDIARIEAGEIKLYIEPVNIKSIINELFLFFKKDAEKKNLHFSSVVSLSEENSNVLIDKTKVNQIITNLIQNALKYTDQGSVEFGCMMKNEQLKFYVKDSGMGVPSHLQKKIFDRFRRVDSESRYAYQGAGLGLSICQGFVKMMGGSIWVESFEKVGSCFYFTVPFDRSSVKEPEPAGTPFLEEIHLKRTISILIAEDDEASYLLLQKILSKRNIETISVDNGQAAIDFVGKKNPVDLILMDMKMPVVNGYSAAKKIKELNPQIPIVGQSAFASPNDRNKALESGCDDYISKPINISRLFALIEKHIPKNGAEQR